MDEMNLLQLSEDDMKSLRETFYQQAVELVESLVQEVLLLEGSKDTAARLKTIKRVFHTLKGDSASIGLKALSGLTHKAEDLIHIVESKSLEIDSDLTDLLLKVADCISGAIEAGRSGKDMPEALPVMRDNIVNFMKNRDSEQAVAAAAAQAGCSLTLGEYEKILIAELRKKDKRVYRLKISFSPDCQMKSAGAVILAHHLTTVGEVVKSAPPLDSIEIEAVKTVELIMGSDADAAALKGQCVIPGIVCDVSVEEYKEEPAASAVVAVVKSGDDSAAVSGISRTGTIRVESERMDHIMDLVGELVMGRSMIAQILSEFEDRFPKDDMIGRFAYANSFIERSLSDLQRNVMKVRMIPIDRVFKRFPRVVRDLARAGGKDIKLIIHGEDTEVDKGLVDVIGEPLIHIVRNAVDHGIEPTEERAAAGKDRQGTIALEAYHQGNDMVIEIRDDGRGLDPGKLKDKALEKGIVTREEIEKMDDKEAFALIFLPGFSTAKTISEVSGRGIGMDVVKTVVESMRGAVQVKSEIGKGTVFLLRFPLTLAIIRAILFNAGDRLFAIPLASVKEITRAFVKNIEIIGGREALRLRNKVIPLIRLEEMMNVGAAEQQKNKLFIVIVNIEEKDVGIVVSRLVGEEELVIKTITNQWVDTEVVGGASILGDGRVVLILNVGAIIKKVGIKRMHGELFAASN